MTLIHQEECDFWCLEIEFTLKMVTIPRSVLEFEFANAPSY